VLYITTAAYLIIGEFTESIAAIIKAGILRELGEVGMKSRILFDFMPNHQSY
jgi:hypothetical protein